MQLSIESIILPNTYKGGRLDSKYLLFSSRTSTYRLSRTCYEEIVLLYILLYSGEKEYLRRIVLLYYYKTITLTKLLPTV